MGTFRTGDFVITPSGRIAKVNRFWEESRRDDYARVDLTYADTGEPVRLAPSLLKLHQGKEPVRPPRKDRIDAWQPKRQFGGKPVNPLPPVSLIDQILLMDGCLKTDVQGRAGGLASAGRRRRGKPS